MNKCNHTNELIEDGIKKVLSFNRSDLLKFRDKICIYFKNNLDVNKKYICFSGDDETTSPLDQFYLEDLANAIIRSTATGLVLGGTYQAHH